MKNRSVRQHIKAERVNMGGHLLDQPLPSQFADYIDPFLLIHHWKSEMKGDQSQKDVGVGPHPHRGFSPVTFVFEGDIHHRDSLGNDAIVGAGGTQWMHAGRGVTHSERPSQKMATEGGALEFIQFWVNTPSASKLETPYYLPISAEDTPKVVENGVEIGVVAGEFKGVSGPAKHYSPQTLLRIEAEVGADIDLPLPADYNTLLYILSGSLEVEGQSAGEKDMVWFNNDGDLIELKATEKSRFIVLSGQPINEKVASYGPFVMNNQTEIMEALRDAQMGKMGVLIEEFDDQARKIHKISS